MSLRTEPGAAAAAVAPAPAPHRGRWLTAVAVLLALALGVTAGLAAPLLRRPGDDSVEAAFLRDMANHHAQAVQMAMIAHEHGTDANVRRLAADIALMQHGQINIMQTWLRGWGLSVTSTEPPMSWMPATGGAPTQAGGLMPGMATQQEMTALQGATGKQVDIQFLTLMRRHHIGGVHMAQEAVKLSDNADVDRLAQSMADGQQYEIALIDRLLKAVQGSA